MQLPRARWWGSGGVPTSTCQPRETVTSTEAAAAVPVPGCGGSRIFSWFSRSITRTAIFNIRFLGFAPGAFYSTPVTAVRRSVGDPLEAFADSRAALDDEMADDALPF